MGNFIVMEGMDVVVIDFLDGCFNFFDNFVMVDCQEVDGVIVWFEDGGDEIFVCVGDGVVDIFGFVNILVGVDEYIYLIIDIDNNIFVIVFFGSFDFEGIDVGVCWVWGLVYGGILLVEVGDNVVIVVLVDGCFGLLENFIMVWCEVVEGGIVAVVSGFDFIIVCFDGMFNVIGFEMMGIFMGIYVYVIIIDELIIVDLVDGDIYDFDVFEEGIYYVWGLVYIGNFMAGVGDDVLVVIFFDECNDFFDNFVIVIVEMFNGGIVVIEDGEIIVFICFGDGVVDVIEFDSVGIFQGVYIYVIMDENNEILVLLGGDSFDFDDVFVGICWVWGLVYFGNIIVVVGDIVFDVELIDECFSFFENFIIVIC